MGATVAAVIAAKERAIVEAFRDAGATALVTAVPLEQLGVEENVGFRRLRRHEVIREAVLLTIVVLIAIGVSLGTTLRIP